MVDTQDLKSCDLNSREGSSPSPGTNMDNKLIFEVGVKAVITDGKGKYLLLKKAEAYSNDLKNGFPNRRRWDLPGGRVEVGEPVRDGLRREILEETNLQLAEIIKIVDVHDAFFHEGYHSVRIYFEVMTSGEIKVSPEHSEAQWLTFTEIKVLHSKNELERSTAKLFADLAQW